jgi:hypothetical protein
MKAFRIRIPDTNPGKNVFRFILLYKCTHIDLNYQVLDQLAIVQLLTTIGETYTLNRFMPSYEFESFQSRYLKFINSDELFFNLSDFNLITDLKFK